MAIFVNLHDVQISNPIKQIVLRNATTRVQICALTEGALLV